MDLFASRKSTHLPVYLPIDRKDRRAVGINASAQRWKFKKKYAFSPPQLIPLLLAKMREILGVLILITPFLTRSAWLSEPGLAPVVHTATSTASRSSRHGNGSAQREPFTISQKAQVVNVVVIQRTFWYEGNRSTNGGVHLSLIEEIHDGPVQICMAIMVSVV